MDTTTEMIQESAETSVNEVQAEMNAFMQYLQDHIPDMISFGIRLGIACLIFIIGRFLIQVIRKSVRRSIERSNADTGVAQFTDSLLNRSVCAAAYDHSRKSWNRNVFCYSIVCGGRCRYFIGFAGNAVQSGRRCGRFCF